MLQELSAGTVFQPTGPVIADGNFPGLRYPTVQSVCHASVAKSANKVEKSLIWLSYAKYFLSPGRKYFDSPVLKFPRETITKGSYKVLPLDELTPREQSSTVYVNELQDSNKISMQFVLCNTMYYYVIILTLEHCYLYTPA